MLHAIVYMPISTQLVDACVIIFSVLSIKEEINFEAVSCGAILSDYQRIRVENVCSRLDLVSLAYLWRRDQDQLLKVRLIQ